MTSANGSCPFDGPAIRAVDAWAPVAPGKPIATKCRQLFSEQERANLAAIASIVRFKKGDTIYGDGGPAAILFNIISGTIKTYKLMPDGSEHIVAFLHPLDVVGLSVRGRYVNSAKALTPVTAYALPISALRRQMAQAPDLQFNFVEKLCHALRQAQDHALILAEKHGLSKLAMYLQMQERLQSCRGEPTGEIYLPMARTDIAKYVGMSLGALSRSFHALAARGIISNRDRRHVKIIDRHGLEALGGEPSSPMGGSCSG